MTMHVLGRPRGAVWGTASLMLAGLVASEGLNPMLRRRPPVIHPPAGDDPEGDVILGFHGLRGCPADFDELVSRLHDLGQFHLVATGSDFRQSAPAGIKRVLKLPSRPLLIMGESLGGLCALEALCLAHAAKLSVAGIVIVSTPATPAHPHWPPGMRRATRLLRGGAPTYAIVQLQTVIDLAHAYRRDREHLPEAWTYARRCLRLPSASFTSGGRMMLMGAPQTGVPDVPCLVIQFEQDPWVLPGFSVLQEILPQAELVTIPRRGHNSRDSPDVIATAIRDWRSRHR
jgi:hypothetical protein